MKYTKVHSVGNDYLIVNCYEEQVNKPDEIAVTSCHRHFGIGADGLILISYSQHGDFKVELYNTDGIECKPSPNALICCVKYIVDNGISDKLTISFETIAGVKYVTVDDIDGKVVFTVNCGKAIFTPQLIPIDSCEDTFIDKTITIKNDNYEISCVLVENKVNTVIFVDNGDELNEYELAKIAPYIERHNMFPMGTNIQIANIVEKNLAQVRCWQLDEGEVMGCDFGAASVFAIANHKDMVNDKITVELLGGDIEFSIDEDGYIYQSSYAEIVFSIDF